MHSFFLDEARGAGPGEEVLLPEKLAHQVRDVLHLSVGEQLILLDNSADELLCVLTRSSRTTVAVEILERRAGQSSSPVRIILCQGLLKSARFEWILEKGTELGVASFSPILCRRSQAGLEEAGPAKIQRWQRIIQEATEQCGRTQRPALLPISPITQVINNLPAGALAIMPWEEEHAVSLSDVLQAVSISDLQSKPQALTVMVFIGPEGGLLAEEVALARQQGVHIVTLGTRILRAETAALATVANIMYALESRF